MCAFDPSDWHSLFYSTWRRDKQREREKNNSTQCFHGTLKNLKKRNWRMNRRNRSHCNKTMFIAIELATISVQNYYNIKYFFSSFRLFYFSKKKMFSSYFHLVVWFSVDFDTPLHMQYVHTHTHSNWNWQNERNTMMSELSKRVYVHYKLMVADENQVKGPSLQLPRQ